MTNCTATQKEIAIKCLEKLNIYKPYINKFKSKGIPCFFERFAGFYTDQEPALYEKVKKVEEEFSVLVYAITHELLEFGECWSMLCVSNGVESVDEHIMDTSRPDTFYAYAYVYNADAEFCSEFGDIVVKSCGGGIRRIG